MQEMEPRQRRAKYPGLGVLTFLALMTLVVLVGWFVKRQGGRETECGSDCSIVITSPVPESAFVVGGLVLGALVVAMVLVVRAGRSR